MARAIRHRHPDPISAINVTPFIDVLLVLLIMIILTVPVAMNKLPIDLPHGPNVTVPLTPPHKLLIDRQGTLFWDGTQVSDAQLPALLATVARSEDGALHLQTDPETRYERFNAVLGKIKRAGVTRLGFVGNMPLDR